MVRATTSCRLTAIISIAQGWHGNRSTDERAPPSIDPRARPAADSLSALMAAVTAHPPAVGALLALVSKSVWASFELTSGRGTGSTREGAVCSGGYSRWC